MPYDANDPRAQLATAAVAAAGVPRAAQYRQLTAGAADETHASGSTTSWTRSQAVVIGFTVAAAGDTFDPVDSADEYVILTLDGAAMIIGHDDADQVVDEPALVVVPDGSATVTVTSPGTVVRIFAAPSVPELAARCANAEAYRDPDRNVAPYERWPEPLDGRRVRVYPMADIPSEPGRFGRLFRCTTVMVNLLSDNEGPRDTTKLSPHHHEDFEQISLQVHGDYVHHMRRPWVPDSTLWVEDEHQHCVAPALVVIPPPLVHTSQAVGDMRHWLIDVFAPPRLDFSRRPGWVLNADEYPAADAALVP